MQVLVCSFGTPVQAQVSIYVKRKKDVVMLTWPETLLRKMPAHPCRVLIELPRSSTIAEYRMCCSAGLLRLLS